FIADNVRQHTFANSAALTVRRYGSAPSCAVGAFVSRDGLWVTSYQAIRGADGLTGSTAAVPTADIRVAAYDVAANLAVLRFPGSRPDSIVLSQNIADGQSAWA